MFDGFHLDRVVRAFSVLCRVPFAGDFMRQGGISSNMKWLFDKILLPLDPYTNQMVKPCEVDSSILVL